MKRNDITFLLVSSVIVTIAWIVFSVIHATNTSTIPENLSTAIEPIAPAFDTNTITTLQGRQKIAPVYNFVQATPTPAQTPAPISILSPSVSLSPSQTTSPSPTPT